MGTNAQIRKSLDDRLAVADHLRFVEGLVNDYDLGPERSGELRSTVDRIRRRHRDPALYLGVIGEFSSGKSTLINALLGEPLLKSSVIQATTAAVTLLRHGPSPALEVERADGEDRTFAGEDLTAALHRFSSEEEMARQVERITLRLPAPALEDGLVIVDTPGLNATVERHGEVTRRAVEETCDTTLVVVPADTPVSHTLAAFLDRHLAPSLHRCVFVVSKIDTVPAAERDALLANVRQRLHRHVGVDDPLVLPVSAAAALGTVNGDGSAALRRQFAATRHRLRDALTAGRGVIVVERLGRLMGDLFDRLSDDLTALEEDFRQEHEVLERHRSQDLGELAERASKTYGAAVREAAAEHRRQAEESLLRRLVRLRSELVRALERAEGDDELRRVLTERVPRRTGEVRRALSTEVTGLLRDLEEEVEQHVAAFEEEFAERYRDLATLGGRRRAEDDAAGRPARGGLQAVSSIFGHLATVAEGDDRKKNLWRGGAAASGALLGNAVLPVVGLVIGGYLGAKLGGLFGGGIDAQRQRYRQQVTASLDEWLEAAQEQIATAFEQGRDAGVDALNGVIRRYLDNYEGLIRRRIADERAAAETLRTRRRKVQRDTEILERRRDRLRTELEHLRQVPFLNTGGPQPGSPKPDIPNPDHPESRPDDPDPRRRHE